MGGGRGIPMLISIPAIVGIGTTIANAKRIVPKSNFFILLPPYPVFIRKWHFPGWFGRVWLFPPFSLPHFIDRKYLGSRLEKAVSHISRSDNHIKGTSEHTRIR
jgi:hypothetical protein